MLKRDTTMLDKFAGAIRASEPPAAAPNFMQGDAQRALAGLIVYRNNVRASITRALGDKFPVLKKLVGDEFFSALSRAFFDANPPRSRLLREYGAELPAFVQSLASAQNHPYLADVAIIEIAWLGAYHGPDAQSLAPAEIIAAAGDNLAAARLDMHPTATLLSVEHGALSIWRANKTDAPTQPLRAEGAEYALIVRPAMDVAVHALEPAQWAALCALKDGRTLGDAFSAAAEADAAFEPNAFFQALFQWEIVSGVRAGK